MTRELTVRMKNSLGFFQDESSGEKENNMIKFISNSLEVCGESPQCSHHKIKGIEYVRI